MRADRAWLARQLQQPGYGLAAGSMDLAVGSNGQPVGWAPDRRAPRPPEAPAPSLADAHLLISGEPVLALILPYPPSINHYYIPVARGKQVISQAGKDYREAVSIAVEKQCAGHATLTGRLAILIEWHAPDTPAQRTRDIDNPEKPLLDALEHAGVYLNDGQIDDKRTRRSTRHQPPYVRITLATCTPGVPPL